MSGAGDLTRAAEEELNAVFTRYSLESILPFEKGAIILLIRPFYFWKQFHRSW